MIEINITKSKVFYNFYKFKIPSIGYFKLIDFVLIWSKINYEKIYYTSVYNSYNPIICTN
jgi:hypothetical protein